MKIKRTNANKATTTEPQEQGVFAKEVAEEYNQATPERKQEILSAYYAAQSDEWIRYYTKVSNYYPKPNLTHAMCLREHERRRIAPIDAKGQLMIF